MRLFEAIVAANHRAAAGDRAASLVPADFADAVPVVALTCIDVRLNRLLPSVLGLPEEHFIWLRNAGNIITGPMSSTMRSLALACAIKGGKEVVVIGHTDCKAGQTTILKLTEAFGELGIDRTRLPADLVDFFGLFASEHQNVHEAVAFIRGSPLIGPRVPVHGLLLDLGSGRVDWVVNGYDGLGQVAARLGDGLRHEVGDAVRGSAQLGGFGLSGMSVPTEPIGDTRTGTEARAASGTAGTSSGTPETPPVAVPPPLSASKLPPGLPTPRFLQPWKRRR